MRILLIEDDVELCRSLSLLLEQQHFSVTSCHDGEEGLFYILENGHDLVLLDRMLPGLDGLEVLRQARAAHCTTPILFLTALGSLEDRVTGLDLGADDYLVKPFAFEELMARIRCICRRPQRLTDQHMTWHDLSFDPEQSMLSCGDRRCSLSRRGRCTALPLSDPPGTDASARDDSSAHLGRGVRCRERQPRQLHPLSPQAPEDRRQSGAACDCTRSRISTDRYMMMVMPGSKGQKAVHACMIRLLNLGPAKHSQSASLLVRSYGIFPQAGECLSAFTFT